MAEHTYTWDGATVDIPSLSLSLKRGQEFTTNRKFDHPDAEETETKSDKAAAPPLKEK